MSCEFICDGCSKREKGEPGNIMGQFLKPQAWYEQFVGGNTHAYSPECIKKIAENAGKTDLVLFI